jgi:hypothetical protein
MMTEYEWYLNLPASKIRLILSDRTNVGARRAYRKEFPLVMGMFNPYVDDVRLGFWWVDFVSDNRSRGDWMRDGWLTGKEYGDV